MKAKLQQIQVVKIENGYVVTAASKSFVALDEEGVRNIINEELSEILELVNKREEEPKDANATGRPESEPKAT
jgi:hypothetical protein